jgi:DNA-binding protein H-NS
MKKPELKKSELKSMSSEALWALHQEVNAVLATKMAAEKRELEKRLKQINLRSGETLGNGRERRPYPQVLPKYRNPAPPHETWSGRGKKPLWVIKQLKSGRRMEEFRIRLS